jgi:hypothetical protein
LQNKHPDRVFFELETVGQPSCWNTLRTLRIVQWYEGQALRILLKRIWQGIEAISGPTGRPYPTNSETIWDDETTALMTTTLITNLSEAEAVLDYFNGFHDGFIKQLTLISHDRFKARGVQASSERLTLEITLAHYNY